MDESTSDALASYKKDRTTWSGLTASSAWFAVQCPASCRLPVAHGPPVEAMTRGTLAHQALAAAAWSFFCNAGRLGSSIADFNSSQEGVQISEDFVASVLSEVNNIANSVKLIETPMAAKVMVGERKSVTVFGTPDLVVASDYELCIVDWKTGRSDGGFEEQYKTQLAVYAAAALQHRNITMPDKISGLIVYVDEIKTTRLSMDERTIKEIMELAANSYLAPGRLQFSPGAYCSRCPSSALCPIAEAETSSPSAAYGIMRACESKAERIKNALRGLVDEAGEAIDLGDGRFYGKVGRAYREFGS